MVSPFVNMRCARTGDSIGASAEVREALAAKNGALTQRQAATAGPTATIGTRFRGKRANQDSQACTSPHLPGRFSNIYQCSVVEFQKHILTSGMPRPHRRTSAETTQRRRPKAATRFNLRGTEDQRAKRHVGLGWYGTAGFCPKLFEGVRHSYMYFIKIARRNGNPKSLAPSYWANIFRHREQRRSVLGLGHVKKPGSIINYIGLNDTSWQPSLNSIAQKNMVR